MNIKDKDLIMKFLKTEFGRKLVLNAYLFGSEWFCYGKKKWKIKELKSYMDQINYENGDVKS